MYKSFHVHIQPFILHCWTAFFILFFLWTKLFKSHFQTNAAISCDQIKCTWGHFSASSKTLNTIAYWNDWISPVKFCWAMLNVTAPSMVTDQACFHLSSVSFAMELFPPSFMTLREPQAWGLGECNGLGLGKYAGQRSAEQEMCVTCYIFTLTFKALCSPPMSSVTGRRSHDHRKHTTVQSFFFWHQLFAVSAAF